MNNNTPHYTELPMAQLEENKGQRFAGGTMPNNLQDLVGMEMQEGGFMSAGNRKGGGFDNKNVIFNIYAPKGVKATYVEPFSSLGLGRGRPAGSRACRPWGRSCGLLDR